MSIFSQHIPYALMFAIETSRNMQGCAGYMQDIPNITQPIYPSSLSK